MMRRICAVLGLAGVAAGVAIGCGTDMAPGIPDVDGGTTADAAKPDSGSPADGGNPADAGDGGTPVETKFVISGTVSGLLGSGLVLQNNGGDDITVNKDGSFTFPTKIAKGGTFAVTVKTQPTAPSQTCTITGGTGTVATGNVTTVVVNCASDKFVLSGTLSGLAGTGLVLQNNAGDDITPNANGEFAFPTTVTDGAAYAVTVKTQPSNLSQTCTVTDGTGTFAGANVTTVKVVCETNKFTIGGTVSGLVGTGLVVQGEGGEVAVPTNGPFTLPTAVTDGTSFTVSVKTSPSGPAQTCSVTGGTGTLAGGNVTSVLVNCATNMYAVGGTVSGLAGSGLVLQNNAGDDVPVKSDGTFAFPTTLEDLSSYAVTVKTQPTNNWQTCTVTNGSGNIAADAVTNVSVVCTTNTYQVKGTVKGLAGTGLVLQNNGGDDLTVAGNGAFTFVAPVASGAGYLVSVLANPVNKNQTCTVTNGSGNVAGAEITDVVVDCVTNKYTIGGTITGLAANGLVLQNNNGDDLPVLADGSFAFATPIEHEGTYAVTVKTQPSNPNQQCVVTGGSGTVSAGNVVSVSVNCTTNKYTVGGTVSGLDGTGLVLQNNGGSDLTVNGSSFAFPAQNDGTGYAITVKTQPTAKSQTCTVTGGGSGTVAGGNVSNVTISCVTNKYSIKGTLTGLASGTIVLQNNAGDDLSLTANGGFTFNTKISSGSTYAVTVKSWPLTQSCSVTTGSGTVTSGDITNVAVTCGALTCSGGANLLSTSPSGTEVVCKHPANSVCEENFETLCPTGWGLCAWKQHVNRRANWTYSPGGTPALGEIYCRAGNAGGGHYTMGPYDVGPMSSHGTSINCGYGSSRASCTSGYGCNEQFASALCCAPTPTCGNGVVDSPEEECDDGNQNETDDCLNSCTWRLPSAHGVVGIGCN